MYVTAAMVVRDLSVIVLHYTNHFLYDFPTSRQIPGN